MISHFEIIIKNKIKSHTPMNNNQARTVRIPASVSTTNEKRFE